MLFYRWGGRALFVGDDGALLLKIMDQSTVEEINGAGLGVAQDYVVTLTEAKRLEEVYKLLAFHNAAMGDFLYPFGDCPVPLHVMCW